MADGNKYGTVVAQSGLCCAAYLHPESALADNESLEREFLLYKRIGFGKQEKDDKIKCVGDVATGLIREILKIERLGIDYSFTDRLITPFSMMVLNAEMHGNRFLVGRDTKISYGLNKFVGFCQLELKVQNQGNGFSHLKYVDFVRDLLEGRNKMRLYRNTLPIDRTEERKIYAEMVSKFSGNGFHDLGLLTILDYFLVVSFHDDGRILTATKSFQEKSAEQKDRERKKRAGLSITQRMR